MPYSEKEELLSRRKLLRTIFWGSVCIALENPAIHTIERGVEIFDHLQKLSRIEDSPWLHKNIVCPTKNGILAPSKRIILGDSLGKGLTQLGKPYAPADGILIQDINTYLQGSWEIKDLAVLGGRAENVIDTLRRGQPGFVSLMSNTETSISLSLLGNDLGYTVFSSYEDPSDVYGILQNPLQPKTIDFIGVVINAFQEYKLGIHTVLSRCIELANQGAHINHLIIAGPPDFSYAPAITFFIPGRNNRGVVKRIALTNEHSKQVAGLISKEILLAYEEVLDEIGTRLPFELALLNNLHVNDFATDQHLTQQGYTQEADHQENRLLADFGLGLESLFQIISQRK